MTKYKKKTKMKCAPAREEEAGKNLFGGRQVLFGITLEDWPAHNS